jgi:hypothetical protein
MIPISGAAQPPGAPIKADYGKPGEMFPKSPASRRGRDAAPPPRGLANLSIGTRPPPAQPRRFTSAATPQQASRRRRGRRQVVGRRWGAPGIAPSCPRQSPLTPRRAVRSERSADLLSGRPCTAAQTGPSGLCRET